MLTLRLAANPAHLDASLPAIAQAAEILRRGGLVAFPTETVYGLGANAFDQDAVAGIFAAKERPAWDPVIVHIGDPALLAQVAAAVPEPAHALIRAFWPGPLTLLLPRHPRLPGIVTAQRELVGVRMPAHPVAQALLLAARVPVAAPSANRFGRTSATTAAHVAEDLDGRIDAILDGGATTHGVESTVLLVRDDGCTILRPGVITLEQIRSVVAGPVTQLPDLATPDSATPNPASPASASHDSASPDTAAPNPASRPDPTASDPAVSHPTAANQPSPGLVSPGLGLRHYAPHARLVLVPEGSAQPQRFAAQARSAQQDGEIVGLMLPRGFPLPPLNHPKVFDWGDWAQPDDLARRLFAGLRFLDAEGATVIVCPMPPAEGIGAALQDRLRKAARR